MGALAGLAASLMQPACQQAPPPPPQHTPVLTGALAGLAASLMQRRHYAEAIVAKTGGLGGTGLGARESTIGVAYDPRFLVFEFVCHLTLREPQASERTCMQHPFKHTGKCMHANTQRRLAS
eukprot:357215-Chlamydomonas_euryale.AAC.4